MRYCIFIFWLLSVPSRLLADDKIAMSFCYEEWRPYAFLDESKQDNGVTIDYLKQKLIAANIRYKFSELPFHLCKQAVISKKIDFILHVDENDNLALIKEPISDWELTFAVTRENELTFEEIIASQNLRIIIARSYNYPKVLEEKMIEMSAKIVKVSFYTGEATATKRLFHRLTAGQGDTMVVDRVWAQQIIKQNQLPIKVFDKLIVSVPQYIGYSTENQVAAQRLESLLLDK